MVFTYSCKVRLKHTDAAGIAYFGEMMNFCHEAYEELLEELELPIQEIIDEAEFFIPVVQCTVDYRQPIFLGETLEISVVPSHLSERSFALSYKIDDGEGKTRAVAGSVHTVVDKLSGDVVDIPEKLREALSSRLPDLSAATT